MQRKPTSAGSAVPRHGVARVISKLGITSRTQAAAWVIQGRVKVNDRLVRDPEFPVRRGIDRIDIAGQDAAAVERVVIMLNKPRGLVTTASDEQGRDTVYTCLAGAELPWLAPVGRLDKASEGLLLLCNDPAWAAGITSPDSGPDKTYHVQVNCIPDPELLLKIGVGIDSDGERLRAKSVRMLRHGKRNAWLEITLDEGRNRQIRRLLAAFDIAVVRLLRIAVGGVHLGTLAKGAWRRLDPAEISALTPIRA